MAQEFSMAELTRAIGNAPSVRQIVGVQSRMQMAIVARDISATEENLRDVEKTIIVNNRCAEYYAERAKAAFQIYEARGCRDNEALLANTTLEATANLYRDNVKALEGYQKQLVRLLKKLRKQLSALDA